MSKHPSLIVATAMCVAAAVNAETWWQQFRGPNCSGASDSANPPAEFAPGTNQIWKTSVPSGASSPCVWGDSIYLTAFEDNKLETLCYQRRDGKLLWKADAKAEKIEEYNTSEGSPAASTPTTDGKRVVSYFGSCGLICYDPRGKVLWRYSLPTSESPGSFGTGGSPIIVDGLVLVGRDQSTGCSLLALDLKTGTKVWETARKDVGPGFGTPIIWKNGGATEIVMPGSFKLKGYDLKTGAERWSLAGMPSFTCTTPVAGDDMLYFAGWSPGKDPGTGPSWDGMLKPADKNNDGVVTLEEAKAVHMDAFFKALDANADGKLTPDDLATMQANMSKGENVLVAIKPGGKGELTESSVVWKQTRGLPYVPSPLLYDHRVYLIKDGGMLSSYDAATGKVFYQQERLDAVGNYYASPVAAAGRIYVASLNGRVTVLEAGGESPKVLHHADFGERISATPALVGEAIYFRTATSLYAFGK